MQKTVELNDTSESKIETIVSVALAVSVFFLLTFQVVSLICWIGLLIFGIIKGDVKNIFSDLKKYPMYIGLIFLYLFYLTGMLWTENYHQGWEDLRIKIPMLLFPFLFLILPVGKRSYAFVRRGLIYGCLLAIIMCFIRSLNHYLNDHDLQDFYYTGFSYLMHPTYFSMYLNLAILMLLQLMIEPEERSVLIKSADVFCFFLFITVVIVLTARLAMLTTLFTLVVFAIIHSNKKKLLLKLLPKFIFGAAIIGFLFYQSTRVNNRFIQIVDVVEKKTDTTAQVDTANHIAYNSTTIRIGLLKNGLALFKENIWTGVGTGDVIPESVKRLNDEGLHVLAHHSTGTHNQYLQTAVSLGIFAVILLLFCIVYPMFEFFKAMEYLFTCFMLIVLVNGLGDTILRASSLFFFTFFGCFFYRYFRSFSVKNV